MNPQIQEQKLKILTCHFDMETKNKEPYCKNCKFKDSCAIRIDYNLDSCDEHEFKD